MIYSPVIFIKRFITIALTAWACSPFFLDAAPECSVRAHSARLAGLDIVKAGSDNDAVGYHNGDMATNGEQLVLSLAKSGDIVFDVGANEGEWSSRLLDYCPTVKQIYAFEPQPTYTAKLNSLFANKPFLLFTVALSNRQGVCDFIVYKENNKLSTLHRRKKVEKQFSLTPQPIKVQTTQLDRFCKRQNIKHIDMLKIDTEGHEWHVLKGAENLLANGSIGIIQFEYGGCYLDAKTTLAQVYHLLQKYGYTVYRLSGKSLIHVDKWRPELENYCFSNYLAIKA